MDVDSSGFLTPRAPIPVNRPFTRVEARAEGVSDQRLASWVRQGLLVTPLKGVYHAAQLPDGLELRLTCLQLVCPPDTVVTGRTAGWLHGAPMVLAPGDHLEVPLLDVRRRPGFRLSNGVARGGERTFLADELVTLEGTVVTSKLRTAADLGMSPGRARAFAGMCAMATVADFERAELMEVLEERGRFAGYRRVRQARALAPLVDPRVGSPAECVLLLAWYDEGDLPQPVPQHPVPGPGGMYYLDLAAPALKYSAEYRGARWHGADREVKDASRLAWLVEHEGWSVDIFEVHDVFGPGCDPGRRLRQGITAARRRFGGLAWTGQNKAGESWLG